VEEGLVAEKGLPVVGGSEKTVEGAAAKEEWGAEG